VEVEAENKAAERDNAAAKVQDLEKELEVFFISFLKPKPKTLSPKPLRDPFTQIQKKKP
jgi:hypothetical protein